MSRPAKLPPGVIRACAGLLEDVYKRQDMEDAERFYGAELEEQLYLFGRNHVMQRVLEDKVLEYLYENRQV